MRDYEILYVVRPEMTEEDLGAAVQMVTSLIENLGGAHQRTNVWGKRRLAYEIAHLREGYYVLTDFQLEQERVPELEATLKISDTVFRHQVLRKPRPSARATAKADGTRPPSSEVGPREPEATPASTSGSASGESASQADREPGGELAGEAGAQPEPRPQPDEAPAAAAAAGVEEETAKP
ncbi:MAG: 30S ribosomal protein S6 [Candidatus Dormibacteraceae bacterium]